MSRHSARRERTNHEATLPPTSCNAMNWKIAKNSLITSYVYPLEKKYEIMLSSSESWLIELEEAISDQIHHMNGTKMAPSRDVTWSELVPGSGRFQCHG